MMAGGEDFETESLTFTYDELLGMEFTLVPASAYYEDEDGDGVWDPTAAMTPPMSKALWKTASPSGVVGILRETEHAALDWASAIPTP